MKNSKKGISLIVLVITIIVIIILAAAVIISLQRNNPINEANEARYRSDLANMQAVLTNTIAKIMAHNQAVVNIVVVDQDDPTSLANIGVSNETATTINSENDIISYTLTDASNSNNASGTIVFASGTNTTDGNGPNLPVWYTGKALPRYKSGTTKWQIYSNGNLKLTVGGNVYDIN